MAESTNQLPQLTNTFSGGMNTDVSDALLKDNMYRDAKDIRIVTNTNSNSYLLHNVEGTSDAIIFTGATISGTVIYLTEIRNLNVLISASTNTFKDWHVYYYDTLQNDGTTVSPQYTLVNVFNCTDSTNGKELTTVDGKYNLSTVTKWEDSDNIKVYIADGGHPIRIVNLANTYTVTSDETLFIYPAAQLGKLLFTGFTSGSLNAGVVQYCYQLYNKNGSETEISPLTEPIYLFSGSATGSSKSITGQYESYSTSKAVTLKIENIDTTKFNKIKLISVFYKENGATPTISLLADTKLTETTYYYTDYDQTALSTYTLDEFNAMTGAKFIPKLIETKNNYLFASNIKYLDNVFDLSYDSRAYRYLYIDEPITYDTTEVNAIYAASLITPSSFYSTYISPGTYSISYKIGRISVSGNSTDGYSYKVSYDDSVTKTIGSTSQIGIIAYVSNAPDIEHFIISGGAIAYTDSDSSVGTLATDTTYGFYKFSCIGNGIAHLGGSFSYVDSSSVTQHVFLTSTLAITISGIASSNYGDATYPTASVSESSMYTDIYDTSSNQYTSFFQSALSSSTVTDTEDAINKYNDLSINSYDFHRASISTDKEHNKYAYYYDNTLSTIIYGGAGNNIKWRFVVSELAEDNTGSPISDTDSSTNSTYYGNSSINTYSQAKSFEGVWAYNVSYDGKLVNRHFISLADSGTTASLNYANFYAQMNLRSLQRDEVYRYGIVFFDKSGNSTPVKWIADIRTPSMTEVGFETFMANEMVSFKSDSSDAYLASMVTRPLGIEFKVTMPSSAVSYEIVRCNRSASDRATLTQGIVSRTMFLYHSASSSDYTQYPEQTPSDVMTINNYTCYPNAAFTQTTYATANAMGCLNFYSPEVAYEYDTMKTSLNDSDFKLCPLKLAFSSIKAMNDHSYNQPYAYIKSNANGTVTTTTDLNKIPENDFITTTYANDTLYYYGQRDSNYLVGKLYEQSNDLLTSSGTTYKVNSQQFSLKSLIFPIEPAYSSYASRTDYASALGVYPYNNWVRTSQSPTTQSLDDPHCVQGPHGRSIALQVDTTDLTTLFSYVCASTRLTPYSYTISNTSAHTTYRSPGKLGTGTAMTFYPESKTGTLICNLRKITTPYGGYDYISRENSTYYSLGKYLTVSGTYTPVYDGDTYISLFDITKLHKYYYSSTDSSYGTEKTDTNYKLLSRFTDFMIPLESVINMSLDKGPTYHRQQSSYIQLQASDVDDKFALTTPLYVYNTVYSQSPKAMIFVPTNDEDEYNKTIDYRTLYSNAKSSDELVDSWSKFQSTNYLDVDSRYGPITDMRTFNNDLIFWQRDATGHFSVAEKSMLTDDSNTTLVLGTGGILTRYDYISTVNGMKEYQQCDVQSEQCLYFFDYDRMELCMYATGEGIRVISKEKGVQNYINHLQLLGTLSDLPQLHYDRYYNEMLATLNGSESLVYNENNALFTSRSSVIVNKPVYNSGRSYYINNNNIYMSILSKDVDDTYNGHVTIFGNPVYPKIDYIVNNFYSSVKVFDNIELSLGSNVADYTKLNFVFNTDAGSSLGDGHGTLMTCSMDGSSLTDREYSYRGAIPRFGDTTIGNRMRGRILFTSVTYNSNLYGLELPYITTKFRVSKI